MGPNQMHSQPFASTSFTPSSRRMTKTVNQSVSLLTSVKYVGLLALAKITRTHGDLVSVHHEIILSCIDDADISIRLRALDLIVGMVSRDTLIDIVKQLILQLLEPPPDSTALPLPDH